MSNVEECDGQEWLGSLQTPIPGFGPQQQITCSFTFAYVGRVACFRAEAGYSHAVESVGGCYAGV